MRIYLPLKWFNNKVTVGQLSLLLGPSKDTKVILVVSPGYKASVEAQMEKLSLDLWSRLEVLEAKGA